MRSYDIPQLNPSSADHSGQIVVVPVAGICNVETDSLPGFHTAATALKLGNLSTVTLHFNRLAQGFRRELGEDTKVAAPVILSRLGIFNTLEDTYEMYETKVNEILGKLPEGTRPLFVGHSAGGTMAMRGIAANEQWNSAGIITLGSPHQKVRGSLAVPVSRRWKQISRFASETQDMLHDTDNQVPKTVVGTMLDQVVPPRACVTEFPGDNNHRLMYTVKGRLPRDSDGIRPVRGIVDHTMLPVHGGVIRETARLAGQMIHLSSALAPVIELDSRRQPDVDGIVQTATGSA